jgi:hypothetical protein
MYYCMNQHRLESMVSDGISCHRISLDLSTTTIRHLDVVFDALALNYKQKQTISMILYHALDFKGKTNSSFYTWAAKVVLAMHYRDSTR